MRRSPDSGLGDMGILAECKSTSGTGFRQSAVGISRLGEGSIGGTSGHWNLSSLNLLPDSLTISRIINKDTLMGSPKSWASAGIRNCTRLSRYLSTHGWGYYVGQATIIDPYPCAYFGHTQLFSPRFYIEKISCRPYCKCNA